MKLRNKKTGEIMVFGEGIVDLQKIGCKNVHEMIEAGWEDYEEPKEHWCITMYGGITRIKDDEEPVDDLKEIGNYFNSKEDAYDALDKLKAWTRLEDKGFKFGGWYFEYDKQEWVIRLKPGTYEEFVIGQTKQDLDLLFGGEK